MSKISTYEVFGTLKVAPDETEKNYLFAEESLDDLLEQYYL
jgi:hypothetical protein